jgi:hypothetical protein
MKMRAVYIAVALLSLIAAANAACTAVVDGTTYDLSSIASDQTIRYNDPTQGKTVSIEVTMIENNSN